MFDLQTSKYFNSLPQFLKEVVTQGGIKFNNEDELKLFVSNIEQS